MPSVQTNGPYPTRIAVYCAPYIGPFQSAGPLGAFNPIRDLEVYVDGVKLPIQTWYFDAANNRYLLFMDQQINLQGVVQVICHMPGSAFHNGTIGWGQSWGSFWGSAPSGTVGSFAVFGTFVP